MPVQVVIADDHKLMRQGLSSLLRGHPDIEVVGEANNGREAVQLSETHRPDVVIMDVSMPDLNGIDATRQIVARNPRARIIALSMHNDRQFAAEMFRAGAKGYLLKDSAFEELASAIRAVARDESFVASAMCGFSVEKSRNENRVEVASARLSEREREVLQLIAEGKTTKEIAATLFLSAKTVETHRQHLMDKLEIRSVAELTKFALREGLTTLDQ